MEMVKEDFTFLRKEGPVDVAESYRILAIAVGNLLNTLKKSDTLGGEIFTFLGTLQKEHFKRLFEISQAGYLSPGILDIEGASDEEKAMIEALFTTEGFQAFREKLGRPEVSLSEVLPVIKSALEKFYEKKLKYYLEKK